MGFRKKSYKYLMSIPHLALLWDIRKYRRYEPLEGLDIEIISKGIKIYGHLVDISLGGMRIISTDKRIKDSTSIRISVDDFYMELPCEKIRSVQFHYGIVFGTMDARTLSRLRYFIDHNTTKLNSSGNTEIMR